jgi:hypothetical protein
MLLPLCTTRAGVLEVAFYEAGPADGPPVLLMHGHDWGGRAACVVASL